MTVESDSAKWRSFAVEQARISLLLQRDFNQRNSDYWRQVHEKYEREGKLDHQQKKA